MRRRRIKLELKDALICVRTTFASPSSGTALVPRKCEWSIRTSALQLPHLEPISRTQGPCFDSPPAASPRRAISAAADLEFPDHTRQALQSHGPVGTHRVTLGPPYADDAVRVDGGPWWWRVQRVSTSHIGACTADARSSTCSRHTCSLSLGWM